MIRELGVPARRGRAIVVGPAGHAAPGVSGKAHLGDTDDVEATMVEGKAHVRGDLRHGIHGRLVIGDDYGGHGPLGAQTVSHKARCASQGIKEWKGGAGDQSALPIKSGHHEGGAGRGAAKLERQAGNQADDVGLGRRGVHGSSSRGRGTAPLGRRDCSRPRWRGYCRITEGVRTSDNGRSYGS